MRLDKFYRDWALAVLRDYDTLRAAKCNLPERIKSIEDQMTLIRSSMNDATQDKGCDPSREDTRINLIVQKSELEANYRNLSAQIACIEKALSVLDPQEQRVIQLMSIEKKHGAVSRLCDEFNIEVAQVYRIRDSALRKFSLAYNGA